MNEQELRQLRERMGEVAALPPEHPERRAVAERVARAGGEAEREWLALLQWDERVRAELRQVPVPAELERSLLKIPGRQGPGHGRVPGLPVTLTRRAAAAGAVAAMVLLGVGVATYYRGRQTRALAGFADMVAGSHERRPGLAVTSGDFQVVQDALQKDLPFPIMTPHVDPAFHLVGGSVLNLGGRTVFYTRWEHGGRYCSLYQFCAPDYGMRAGLEKTTMVPAGDPRCRVVFWSQGTCDYALVTEEPAAPPPAPGAAPKAAQAGAEVLATEPRGEGVPATSRHRQFLPA